MKKVIFSIFAAVLLTTNGCKDNNDVVEKYVAVTGISLDKTEITISSGETVALKATVIPAEASDKAVIWSSDCEDDIIRVNYRGEVYGTAYDFARTATITATTYDGEHSATCRVTVIPDVLYVKLDQLYLLLNVGDTETVKVTIEPEDAATNKTVTWSSSDETIATVNDGFITAKANGTVTITVSTGEPECKAECVVFVDPMTITRTTSIISNSSFYMAGSGTVTIGYVNQFDGKEDVLFGKIMLNAYSDKWYESSDYSYFLGYSDMIIITGYENITHLFCKRNGLTSLDVSKNTKLEYLNCSGNMLTNLDVSKNTKLEYWDCGSNQLTSLDIRSNSNLEYLNCSNNVLTGLDISNNTKLMNLDCPKNAITSLDISKNTMLSYLDCQINRIKSLDISKNINLGYLNVQDNGIASLNVNKNTALKELHCRFNNLSSLDVSGCTSLEYLECGNSGTLANLNANDCISLEHLRCMGNKLTNLDMKNCISLVSLACGSNQLTSLDVSDCIKLTGLSCSFNNLTASALNALFYTLPIISGTQQVIYILGNTGAGTCDRNIAYNRTWMINDWTP